MKKKKNENKNGTRIGFINKVESCAARYRVIIIDQQEERNLYSQAADDVWEREEKRPRAPWNLIYQILPNLFPEKHREREKKRKEEKKIACARYNRREKEEEKRTKERA